MPKKKTNLLYIEDDRDLCSLFEQRMLEDGYQIDIAYSAESGLKKFKNGEYDLVALDHELPDGFGLNIAEEIIAADPNVLIVMVTGAGSEQVAAESLSVGVDAYVIKEGQETFLDVLPSTISRLLNKKNKERTQALDPNEAFYQSLANFSPVAIFVYIDEQTVFVNPAATKMLGAHSSDELIGKSSTDHIAPDDKEMIRQRIENINSSRSAGPELEVQYQRQDGSIIYVQSTATMISFEGKRARMVMAIDISDRIRASDSEKQFRAFIENVPAAITLKDKDGNFIAVNKIWAEWFNQDKEAVIGKNRLDVFGPEETPAIQVRDDKVFQNAVISEEEYNFTDANGTSRTTLLQKFPIENSNGEFAAIGTIQTDISEFQKAKEELVKAHDRLDVRVNERTKSLHEQILAREGVEQTLREQQEHLQGIMDSVLDGIITISNEGEIKSFNTAAEEIFGHTAKDVVGTNIKRLMLEPETGEHNYLVTGRREATCVKKNGENFLASLAISELEQAGSASFVGIVRDITESTAQERQLRDSERRLRSILEGYGQGIIIHRDRKPLYANPAFAALYDYDSVEEVLALDSVANFTHPDYQLGLNSPEHQVGKPISEISDKDILGIKKNGDTFWEIRRTFVIDWDGRPAVCSVRVDNTDRKMAEELLKESQEKTEEERRKLQSAIDSLHEGFAYFDADDKLVNFNTEFEKRQGKTKKYLDIGIKFEDYVRHHVQSGGILQAVGREEEFIKKRMKKHRNPSGPIISRHDDGLWLLINETKTIDGGTVITMLDITELKKTEEDLRQAMQSAEKANRAKSEFLSSMTHELRTPLNAILGFSQMLARDPDEPLSNSQEKSVQHIMGGGNHLLRLIDDVLDLAKVESGKIELSIEDVPVSESLKDSITSIEPQAQLRGINIVLQSTDAEAAVIPADVTRFRQILLNLLSNGVKYNKENGTLTIFSYVSNNMLRISITDTGDGIPEDRQAELFQPFNRLGQEATLTEGTGIGLVVTKRLVEEMNGDIGFESVAGEGSTFWIEFPLSRKPTIVDALATQGKDHTIFTNLSGHILYVEDNSANVDLMEMIVSRINGLTVTAAKNAELGLEMLQSSCPDLIIMDINLPGINGFEALAKIQDMKDVCDVPVIALSANATQSDIKKGREAGFYDYLTKPIDVGVTLRTIESALNLKS